MSGHDPRDVPARRGSLIGALVFLTAGPLIWAAHFFLIYGLQSALCTFGQNGLRHGAASSITALVIVATVVAMLLLLPIGLRSHWLARLLRFRPPEESTFKFGLSVSRFLTALSMLGVAWAGLVAIILDPCGQLR